MEEGESQTRVLVSAADKGKPAKSFTLSTRGSRLMMLFGSVFIAAWGVFHFFIPSLGKFDEQLQGVPNFTVDYNLLVNFMASLILIVFGILGVLVATRLWADAAAVKLIGWPAGSTARSTQCHGLTVR